jgi:hypothetical protein
VATRNKSAVSAHGRGGCAREHAPRMAKAEDRQPAAAACDERAEVARERAVAAEHLHDAPLATAPQDEHDPEAVERVRLVRVAQHLDVRRVRQEDHHAPRDERVDGREQQDAHAARLHACAPRVSTACANKVLLQQGASCAPVSSQQNSREKCARCSLAPCEHVIAAISVTYTAASKFALARDAHGLLGWSRTCSAGYL